MKNFEESRMIPSSMTDAILETYDKGITVPSSIYSALMFQYPMLSIATINNVIKTFRLPKEKKKQEKKEPKSKAEILSDYLEKRCRACPYYSGLKVCVMPENLCIYPDQKSEGERLKQLIYEENERTKLEREARKKEELTRHESAKKEKRDQQIKKSSVMDELEAELDQLLEESMDAPAEQEEKIFDISEYINVPPRMSDDLFLEDFEDILK